MLEDEDLRSVQQARDLLRQADQAQVKLREFTQGEIDRIAEAMAEAGYLAARKLAQMACAESGFGIPEDKEIKNIVATRMLYDHIKDYKTVGILNNYPGKGIIEIAEPMGVIVGIIPSTNPTSTAMYKAIIALKSRNSIVMSPHPATVNCINVSCKLMHEAAVAAGAPRGCIGCLNIPTMAGTNELMRHKLTSLILATGGSALVKAAYSSGKPAYGVGPGNVPAYIDRSADIAKAVKDIIAGKTFDNGTVCAAEQAIVADLPIKDQVIAELKAQGAYFLNEKEIDLLGARLVTADGRIAGDMVGQPARLIAQRAGFVVPGDTSVLVAQLDDVGASVPLSREKLSPVLAFYVADGWVKACQICIRLLEFGGMGHTMVIHCRDPEVILEYGLKKPAFRILVNTPSTHGAIGYTTGLDPALTLGCGTWGGSSTADNINPLHLLNIKRVAVGIKDTDGNPIPDWDIIGLSRNNSHKPATRRSYKDDDENMISDEQINQIVARGIKNIRK